MNSNIFNKQYLVRKDNIGKNDKKTSNKEENEEMLMNLWDSGTEEEQVKLAYALLKMARDTNKY